MELISPRKDAKISARPQVDSSNDATGKYSVRGAKGAWFGESVVSVGSLDPRATVSNSNGNAGDLELILLNFKAGKYKFTVNLMERLVLDPSANRGTANPDEADPAWITSKSVVDVPSTVEFQYGQDYSTIQDSHLVVPFFAGDGFARIRSQWSTTMDISVQVPADNEATVVVKFKPRLRAIRMDRVFALGRITVTQYTKPDNTVVKP
jgi:hypothetical protein